MNNYTDLYIIKRHLRLYFFLELTFLLTVHSYQRVLLFWKVMRLISFTHLRENNDMPWARRRVWKLIQVCVIKLPCCIAKYIPRCVNGVVG